MYLYLEGKDPEILGVLMGLSGKMEEMLQNMVNQIDIMLNPQDKSFFTYFTMTSNAFTEKLVSISENMSDVEMNKAHHQISNTDSSVFKHYIKCLTNEDFRHIKKQIFSKKTNGVFLVNKESYQKEVFH